MIFHFAAPLFRLERRGFFVRISKIALDFLFIKCYNVNVCDTEKNLSERGK